MTWPLDGEPRFKVSSVTGYGGDGGNNARVATVYSVLDRSSCHRQVFSTLQESVAVTIAAEMNAGDGDSLSLRRIGVRRKSWARRKAAYGQRP